MEAEVGMLVVETIAKIRCESARGPDADRHVKLLIQFAVEGSLSGAYSHRISTSSEIRDPQHKKMDWIESTA